MGTGFGQFKAIARLSEQRRLPRLGKIHLGTKEKTAKGTEYPKETAWFVVPEDLVKTLGNDKPTLLNVQLPVDDPTVVFPQAYKLYGSSLGLKCSGDGEAAVEKLDNGTTREKKCPCPMAEPTVKDGKTYPPQCGPRASFMVFIREVGLRGCYQIDTGSINSIIDINSSMDMVRAQVEECSRGRITSLAGIPLQLVREPKITHGGGKRGLHYTMRLQIEPAFEAALRAAYSRAVFAMLPPPPDDDGERPEDALIEQPEGTPPVFGFDPETPEGGEARGPLAAEQARETQPEPPKEEEKDLGFGDGPDPKGPITRETANYLQQLTKLYPQAKTAVFNHMKVVGYTKGSEMTEGEGCGLITFCQEFAPPSEPGQAPAKDAPQEAAEGPKDEPRSEEAKPAEKKVYPITEGTLALVRGHYGRGGAVELFIEAAMAGYGVTDSNPAKLTEVQGGQLVGLCIQKYGAIGAAFSPGLRTGGP